jgi:hypothetical protein
MREDRENERRKPSRVEGGLDPSIQILQDVLCEQPQNVNQIDTRNAVECFKVNKKNSLESHKHVFFFRMTTLFSFV